MAAQSYIVERDGMIDQQELDYYIKSKPYTRPEENILGAREKYEDIEEQIAKTLSPEELPLEFLREKAHSFNVNERQDEGDLSDSPVSEHEVRTNIKDIVRKYTSGAIEKSRV